MIPLPVKHEMFARSLITHQGNQARAYLNVYKRCSTKSAPSKASRLVRNGNILDRAHELLMGNSAVIEKAIMRIGENLDAVKMIRCKGGKLVSVPDYRARRLAARIALKLLGDL